jgi:hypothetical protein
MEKAHAAAACVTIAVLAFIVTVAVREPPLFAAAVTVIRPLPVPDVGSEIASHAAFEVACQAHASPVAIVSVAVPPLDGIDCAFGVSV